MLDLEQSRAIVGDWIREKRTETGLGRVRFARHCEALGCAAIHSDSIRYWEAAKQMPEAYTLAGLLEALEPDLKKRQAILAAKLRLDQATFARILGSTI